MDVVIAYDIATGDHHGPTRLRKIADICQAYGQRTQLSLFECRLSPTQLARLVGEIQDAIDPNRDTVAIYRISGDLNDHKTVLGLDDTHILGTPWLA